MSTCPEPETGHFLRGTDSKLDLKGKHSLSGKDSVVRRRKGVVQAEGASGAWRVLCLAGEEGFGVRLQGGTDQRSI